MPKQKPQQKPTVANDNHDQNIGRRGHTKVGGNKIHGDDLEAVIPTTPMKVDDKGDKPPPK